MKKHNVISSNCLPTRPPVLFGFVLWLLLDRLHTPGWLDGALWCLYALLLAAAFINLARERDVKIDGFGPKGGDA